LLLARNLRASGVSVDEFPFSQQSVGRIALTLYGLLRDGRIGLPDDADLLDELAHVRLRESSPGVFRLDHDADRHDDRAVALALVAHQLAGSPSGRASASGPPSSAPIRRPRSGSHNSAQMLTFANGRRVPVRRGSIQQRLGGRK
jgi:hypothetical protein